MNLNALVSRVIATVNPMVPAQWLVSNGYTVGPDGTQAPQYRAPVAVLVQDQALSGEQLRHMDSLNIQGILRTLYLNGNVEGIDRPAAKGGDLFKFKSKVWLVVHVDEPWNDSAGWTCCVVQQQLSS